MNTEVGQRRIIAILVTALLIVFAVIICSVCTDKKPDTGNDKEEVKTEVQTVTETPALITLGSIDNLQIVLDPETGIEYLYGEGGALSPRYSSTGHIYNLFDEFGLNTQEDRDKYIASLK